MKVGDLQVPPGLGNPPFNPWQWQRRLWKPGLTPGTWKAWLSDQHLSGFMAYHITHINKLRENIHFHHWSSPHRYNLFPRKSDQSFFPPHGNKILCLYICLFLIPGHFSWLSHKFTAAVFWAGGSRLYIISRVTSLFTFSMAERNHLKCNVSCNSLPPDLLWIALFISFSHSAKGPRSDSVRGLPLGTIRQVSCSKQTQQAPVSAAKQSLQINNATSRFCCCCPWSVLVSSQWKFWKPTKCWDAAMFCSHWEWQRNGAVVFHEGNINFAFLEIRLLF